MNVGKNIFLQSLVPLQSKHTQTMIVIVEENDAVKEEQELLPIQPKIANYAEALKHYKM